MLQRSPGPSTQPKSLKPLLPLDAPTFRLRLYLQTVLARSPDPSTQPTSFKTTFGIRLLIPTAFKPTIVQSKVPHSASFRCCSLSLSLRVNLPALLAWQTQQVVVVDDALLQVVHTEQNFLVAYRSTHSSDQTTQLTKGWQGQSKQRKKNICSDGTAKRLYENDDNVTQRKHSTG